MVVKFRQLIRRKGVAALFVLPLIILLGLGVWLIAWHIYAVPLVKPRPISETGLGVVYFPVGGRNSSYYGLVDVNYGALVTEVVPGSPADKAGLQQGDVITSFNGTELNEGVSLVRLLIECTKGHGEAEHIVKVHVLRGGCVFQLELTHYSDGGN